MTTYGRIRLTISLALGLALLAPTAAMGDEVQHPISAYAVHTDGGAILGAHAEASGHVGAATTLTIGSDAVLHAGAFSGGGLTVNDRSRIEGLILAGANLVLHSDARAENSAQAGGNATAGPRVQVLGDLDATGAVSVDSTATVSGTTTASATLPYTWARPSVVEPAYSPGAVDVTVDPDQTLVLAPGDYAALTLRDRARVELSAGVYHFLSVSAGADSVIAIDDSGGSVEIYAQGAIDLTDRAAVELDSGSADSVSWFCGGDMDIPSDTELYGPVRCFGTLTLGDRVRTHGSLYALDGFVCGMQCVLDAASDTGVLFVRPGGSDSADGASYATALRTIQAAVNRCDAPGMSVYIAPGTYPESVVIGSGSGASAVSGTRDQIISLLGDTTGELTGAAPGEVVLDGGLSRGVGITIDGRVFWRVSGLSLRDQLQTGLSATDAGFELLGCEVDVPAGDAVTGTVAGDVIVSGCRFPRDADSGSVITLTATAPAEAASISIVRNDMAMRGALYKSTGFELGQQTLDARTGSNKHIDGITIAGGPGADLTRIEISNNLVTDCSTAIAVSSIADPGCAVVIANNTIAGSLTSIEADPGAVASLRVVNTIIDSCCYGAITVASGAGSWGVAGLLEHDITTPMSVYQRPYELDVITTSPRFTNPREGVFALQRGSAAIDAGTATDAPGVDIESRSRPGDGDEDGIARVDLGAWELVAFPERVRVVRWREIGSVDAD